MYGNGDADITEASYKCLEKHLSRRCVWSVGCDVEANGIGKDVIEALGAWDVDTIHAGTPKRLNIGKREIGKPYVVGLAFVKMPIPPISVSRH